MSQIDLTIFNNKDINDNDNHNCNVNQCKSIHRIISGLIYYKVP